MTIQFNHMSLFIKIHSIDGEEPWGEKNALISFNDEYFIPTDHFFFTSVSFGIMIFVLNELTGRGEKRFSNEVELMIIFSFVERFVHKFQDMHRHVSSVFI